MGNDPAQDTLWSIPGDGVLARQGSLVLLVSIGDQGFAQALLDLLARVSKDGGDGRDLADAVGAEIERHQSWGGAEPGPAVVSFGPVSFGSAPGPAFGPAGGGTAFAVSGTACVDLSTPHGSERLTVAHPSMVLKSTVGVGVHSVRAALDREQSGSGTDRFTRLDGGTVRAGGLSYYSAAAYPAAAPAPDGPEPDPDGTGPAVALRVPESAEPDTADYGFSPNTLVGTVIPAVKRPAPGPSLGALILEDGTTLPVDGDYVIGRDPEQDQSVAARTARPLRITDAKHTVSRVHARIHLDQGQVLITDLGSANGTHVQARDGQMPLLLEPHVPVPVVPGARIFVGAPCLRYERSVDGNYVGKV